MNRNVVLTGVASVTVAAIAVAAGIYFTRAPAFEPVGLLPPADLGGAFTLVGSDGAEFSSGDLSGSGAMLYFGFTYCPDVCPTELARVAGAVDQLAEEGIAVTPVFITVDPERDGPELVGDYADLFHPDMIGLTGSVAQIEQVAEQYGVYYRRVEDGSATDYLLDHSSYIYLLDPTGRLVWMFRPTDGVDAMVQTIVEAAA